MKMGMMGLTFNQYKITFHIKSIFNKKHAALLLLLCFKITFRDFKVQRESIKVC